MKKKDDRVFYLGNAADNMLGQKSEPNKYDNINYTYDINNEKDGHAVVAKHIKSNTNVLDIGCASGLMGKLLKEHKNCSIDGIEYDREAIKFAEQKNCYDELFCFSITDKNNDDYKKFSSKEKKYDYVLFCDVLEHLVDPSDVLLSVAKFLKPNGKILACVPNIAHIDIIRGLINGEFNYSSLGILDTTHLRFFTESSFLDMIKSMNSWNDIKFQAKMVDRVVIEPYYLNDSDFYKLFKLNDDFERFNTLQLVFELEISNQELCIDDVKYDREYCIKINQYLNTQREKLELISSQYDALKDINDKLRIDQLNENNKQKHIVKKVLKKAKNIFDKEK